MVLLMADEAVAPIEFSEVSASKKASRNILAGQAALSSMLTAVGM